MIKDMAKWLACIIIIVTIISGCDNAQSVMANTEQTTKQTVTTTQESKTDILADETKVTTAQTTESTTEATTATTTTTTKATTTKLTTTTSKTTKAPTTAKAAWKTAYLNYIETVDGGQEYELVYLDADDIPELFIYGNCEAAGEIVCSFKNGKVVVQHLSRLDGSSFIPQSGMVRNFNGNMGYYSLGIYKLTNSGFVKLLSALEQHEYLTDVDEYGEFYDVEVVKYYLYDEEVTEQEFWDAQYQVYDFSKAVPFETNYSYDQIKKAINNW